MAAALSTVPPYHPPTPLLVVFYYNMVSQLYGAILGLVGGDMCGRTYLCVERAVDAPG